MFNLAEDFQLPVVSLTSVGNQAAWPMNSPLGGLPTKITLRLTEIAPAGHGSSAEDIRLKAEVSMQADVTAMLEERGNVKPKEN